MKTVINIEYSSKMARYSYCNNRFMLVTLLFSIIIMSILSKETECKVEKSLDMHQTFRSRNVTVHVVPDFLPQDLAMKWRDLMLKEWDERTMCSSCALGNEACSANLKADICNDSQSSWQYTTNNNGISTNTKINNAKVRSLDNILARNTTAHKMKRSDQFSYAKWELNPSHPLVEEMERTFVSDDIRHKVKHILRQENDKVELAKELSDFFVTQYSTGDFLSLHNDGASGTYAFVLSLMNGPPQRDWEEGFGGSLRFQCPNAVSHQIKWCNHLMPSFNTAIIFQTRPAGPFHEILPVSWQAEVEGFQRFGLTGWYMDPSDVQSDTFKIERDKMRGRL